MWLLWNPLRKVWIILFDIENFSSDKNTIQKDVQFLILQQVIRYNLTVLYSMIFIPDFTRIIVQSRRITGVY